jgi:hypothetical protein
MGVVGEDKMRVITPRFSGDLNVKSSFGNDWDPTRHAPLSTNTELAPIAYPKGVLADSLFDQIATNTREIRTTISLQTKAKSEPLTAVMVTYRDGSKHLMPQTADAIDQIYASYILAFGHLKEEHQPQLYLVGHSFGGIVARTILANPEGADLFGNKLTAEQRWRADFLRSRVVHVTTMAAPHHGTPMGFVAPDIARVIRALSAAGVQVVQNSPLLEKLDLKRDLLTKIHEATKSALAGVSGERDCHADLRRVDEYNAGILKPGTATRGAAGAAGLVPIYTMAGRTPSGMSFTLDRAVPLIGLEGAIDRPYDVLDLINGPKRDFGGEWSLDIRRAREALALYTIQGAMHYYGYGKAPKSPWGRSTIPEADYVKSPWAGKGASALRTSNTPFAIDGAHLGPIVFGMLGGNVFETGQDGDNDSDGFLGWDSAHGLGVAGNNWYRLYDRTKYGTWMPWDIDNHGSIMFNVGVGAYIHNEMLRKAGPNVVAGSRLSLYPGQAPVQPEKHDVKVQLLEVHDKDNALDPATDADFQVRVRIAESHQKSKEISGRTVTTFGAFSHSNIPSSIIPIRISVNEIDDGADPDDNVVITDHWGREDLFLYFDTRTGRVLGDKTIESNSTFKVEGMPGVQNRGFIKLKITGK